jgi:hypothetical protein
MRRNGTIKFFFNQELFVPNFGNRSMDTLDPLQVFDIKYILKSDQDPQKLIFNVSITEWTSTGLVL